MKNRLFFCLLLIAFSGTIIAQDIILPSLEGFKKLTKYPVFLPENLWDFIDGAADTYLAYGFIDLHVAEYKKGKDVIKLEVYRHSDHTMAFGIYSSERSPSFRFMNLGTQGYIADGAINFFKGNFYVKIRTYSKKEKIIHSAESLALKVAGSLNGEAEMPSLLSQFPAEGKKQNEETFINESVLGHKFLNKAFKATYELGADVFSVFIIDGKSDEEAGKTAETYLKLAGMEPVESGSGKYVLNDGYNGTIFLSWKNERIVIISGLSKNQTDIADKFTSEILK